VARSSFLHFRPSSSLICSEPSVVLCQSIFDRGISQNDSYFLCSCLHSCSFCVRFRKVSNVFWSSRMCETFEAEDDHLGESSKSQEVHCCYWNLQPP
jgi:hypothetical protein